MALIQKWLRGMEKPHTGLDDCLRMLQACFRKRMSVPDKLLLPAPVVLLRPDQVPHQRHRPLLPPLREAVVVRRTGAHRLVHHVALLRHRAFRNILKLF